MPLGTVAGVTVELAYAESGRGVPVVLLHAFPLSAAMWDFQREALSGACRVVTPDQRGFGGSPLGADPPSLDAAADDLVDLLDLLGLERVVLGGLSMGGYVAMSFRRRYPDRVAALVLADTKASADSDEGRATRERIATTVLDAGTVDVVADDLLPTLLGETSARDRPALVDRVRGMLGDASPDAVAWASRAMAARPDSYDVLAGADLPALVVVGEEDTLSPVPDAEAMVERLPRGSLVRLPGAGHLSAVEQPEAFTEVLRTFVEGLRGGGRR